MLAGAGAIQFPREHTPNRQACPKKSEAHGLSKKSFFFWSGRGVGAVNDKKIWVRLSFPVKGSCLRSPLKSKGGSMGRTAPGF